MSDSPAPVPSPGPVPARRADDKHPPTNGYPPMEVMQRMLDLQERRLDIEGRQMDLNEANLDRDKELALKSMEYNATANTEHHTAMQRVMKWRYWFWIGVGVLALVVVITALLLGKEAFLVELVKYLAFFVGGYGAKSVVQDRQKNSQSDED